MDETVRVVVGRTYLQRHTEPHRILYRKTGERCT